MPSLKTCSICEREQAIENFFEDARTKDHRRTYCIECDRNRAEELNEHQKLSDSRRRVRSGEE